MGTLRVVKIIAAAGGALLVSGAVIVITATAAGVPLGLPAAAATPTPKPSSSSGAARDQYCQTFLNDFAGDLGKKPADVQAAAQKALGQTLDQAVKDGKLTQAQADQIKQKAAGGALCSGIPFGHGAGPGGPGPGDHGMGALGGMYLGDAAKALGMSQSDLEKALRSGQTLQQVAASKGMNEQQFRDAFSAQVKTDLDAKVKGGQLTQAQEDAVLNKLKTAPLPFWNQAPPMRGARPSPSPTSTSS